jgi:hypothetical protein
MTQTGQNKKLIYSEIQDSSKLNETLVEQNVKNLKIRTIPTNLRVKPGKKPSSSSQLETYSRKILKNKETTPKKILNTGRGDAKTKFKSEKKKKFQDLANKIQVFEKFQIGENQRGLEELHLEKRGCYCFIAPDNQTKIVQHQWEGDLKKGWDSGPMGEEKCGILTDGTLWGDFNT